ncbi:MAG: hypothetical protein IPH82_16925 [Chloroflexi bacterium]|nr:hypothetical protein [Chloroflexota bacterium]
MTWSQVRGLAGITAVSFLAAAINPNGPEMWIYPFLTLGSSAMQLTSSNGIRPIFTSVSSGRFWP